MNTQLANQTSDDDLKKMILSGDQHIATFNKLRSVADIKLKTSNEIEIPKRFPQPLPSIGTVNSHLSPFHMLQQWEGRVIAISKDTFVAIISDRTNPENPQEKVEIELSEISQDDIGLIRPGSFFLLGCRIRGCARCSSATCLQNPLSTSSWLDYSRN